MNAIAVPPINEGQPWSLSVPVTDPDEDFLTFAATGLPTGATIDANTGVINWTPGYTQHGTYPITVTAYDDLPTNRDRFTKAASRLFDITVNDINAAPTIAPVANQVITVGSQVMFLVSANDPDGDSPLTYAAQNLPTGAKFRTDNHYFSWITTASTPVGNYSATFTVSDGHGGISTITVPISVQAYISSGGGGGTSQCYPNCNYDIFKPPFKRSMPD